MNQEFREELGTDQLNEIANYFEYPIYLVEQFDRFFELLEQASAQQLYRFNEHLKTKMRVRPFDVIEESNCSDFYSQLREQPYRFRRVMCALILKWAMEQRRTYQTKNVNDTDSKLEELVVQLNVHKESIKEIGAGAIKLAAERDELREKVKFLDKECNSLGREIDAGKLKLDAEKVRTAAANEHVGTLIDVITHLIND